MYSSIKRQMLQHRGTVSNISHTGAAIFGAITGTSAESQLSERLTPCSPAQVAPRETQNWEEMDSEQCGRLACFCEGSM